MNKPVVKVVNKSSNDLPKYETNTAAGLDVRANIEESICIKPSEHILIPTGLFIQIPDGYECQVRPRSGLAFKKGITVLNTPGTIDADYRGEVGIILINHSKNEFVVNNGDRIAQLVFNKFEQIEWSNVEELNETNRGTGGFGSTGVK
ncbi:MAG: dUTP diphosphatase [Crocinitomicaceae bacterium]|nr:dUTP diphosphatase [Crocinitomicaceae bacterium]|tara:strand:- start:150 stop:593 length:444 start_codon:yes stop_codon:yes gene_type:complete